VILWRARFAQQGLTSLSEIAPGRGRKPTPAAGKIKEIVDATLQTKPKGERTGVVARWPNTWGPATPSELHGNQRLYSPMGSAKLNGRFTAVTGFKFSVWDPHVLHNLKWNLLALKLLW
jgi:hypothetical protein